MPHTVTALLMRTEVSWDVMPLCWKFLPCRRSVVPWSSKCSSPRRKKASWTARPWRQRHHDPSKHHKLLTQHDGVTSEKTWIFKITHVAGSAWLWGPLSQAWGNQQTPSGLRNFLQQSMDNAKQRYPGLWAAMAELTPTPLDVMFNPTGSLRAMADAVNRNLTSWFHNQWWPRANIVATDFFLGNNLIDVAIAANLRKINKVESW